MGTPAAALEAWKGRSEGGSERTLPNGVHSVVLERILIHLISSFPALRVSGVDMSDGVINSMDGQVGVLEPGGGVGQGAALRFHVRLLGSGSVVKVVPANLRGCQLPKI